MLSIFITESLEESNEHVTYFFCRHDDEKRNSETAVLRGLLVQLLRTVSDQLFDQFVWPNFRSDKAASYTLSGPQTIWNIFEALITPQDGRPTFCVLDGFDECDEGSSRQLARRFHDLFAMNKTARSAATFKLAVVGRNRSDLRGFSNIQLKECGLHIRHDIELFIASNVQDALSHKSAFDGDRVLQRISDQLRDRSEGSFLWIGFVVRHLSTCYTSREAMKALECTPDGLEEQYRRILHHIFEDHAEDRKHLQALLAWVALAFVPLTLPQLACAVMGSVSRQHREHISDLLMYCKHLLVVSNKTGVVRLVHTSAKEFLVQSHPTNPSGSGTDRTHVDDGHRTIMRKCLKILEQTTQSDALKPYAVKFLPRHMQACQAADISRELSRPFFTAEDILQSQWEGWRLSHIYPEKYPEATPSPLHIATYWGLIPWAQQLLKARSRVLDIVLRRSFLEATDASGKTPLAIAVSNFDFPMVRWLLQQGALVPLEVARVDDKRGGNSPLDWVFKVDGDWPTLEAWLESPRRKMILLLLTHVSKPTWRSIRQSRALVHACNCEDEQQAQCLLDYIRPPEKTSRIHFSCPALAAALRRGHFRICEQLLDCGADIYSSCEPGRTPLADAIEGFYWKYYVSTANNERILNLLFDEYDKRISTSGGGNPRDILLQSTWGGLIPMLQDIGVYLFTDRATILEDIWRHQKEGQMNALVMAAYYNRGLDLCLKRGRVGRFSDSGYSGRLELIVAVLSGKVDSIAILLRNGADVNATDRHGNPILSLAMKCGFWNVARALLSHGAQVNFIGEADTTPLTEAVRGRTMRRNAFRYFEREERYRFFLNFRKQKLDRVSQLLKHGACTHRRTSAGETALSLAANLGDADTASILIEHGARIAIEDQIFDRGLWRWFSIFKILRMRGKLSNCRCSKLLAARLHLLAKDRLPPKLKSMEFYYHFEEDIEKDLVRHLENEVHVW